MVLWHDVRVITPMMPRWWQNPTNGPCRASQGWRRSADPKIERSESQEVDSAQAIIDPPAASWIIDRPLTAASWIIDRPITAAS